MSGITIIDTIKIYETAWWQLLLGLLPLIIGAVFYFVKWHRALKKGTPAEQACGVVNADNYSVKDFCKSILVLAIGGILSVVLCVCFANVWPAQYVETKYEVSIDETVSFVEFYDNYIMLEETENGTFIVKERGNYE